MVSELFTNSPFYWVWSLTGVFSKRLKPAAAKALLELKMSDDLYNRLNHLCLLASTGKLTEDGKRELEAYETLGCLIEAIHKQALEDLRVGRIASIPARIGWIFALSVFSFLIIAMLNYYINRPPPGYHFILKNYSGSELTEVKLTLPWGEYRVLKLAAIQGNDENQIHRAILRPPCHINDAQITVTAMTSAGVYIEESKDIYFAMNPHFIVIRFEADGTISIREPGPE